MSEATSKTVRFQCFCSNDHDTVILSLIWSCVFWFLYSILCFFIWVFEFSPLTSLPRRFVSAQSCISTMSYFIGFLLTFHYYNYSIPLPTALLIILQRTRFAPNSSFARYISRLIRFWCPRIRLVKCIFHFIRRRSVSCRLEKMRERFNHRD